MVPTAPASTRAAAFEVEAITGLGLFAEERAQSQALLAATLRARDAGVVPPQVTTRAWALAAEGRNPLTGAGCGSPLGSWQARKRWGPALGIAGSLSGHVGCQDDGGCDLTVNGSTLDGNPAERFRLVAPIPREGEALGVLASALPQLAPPAPEPNGGGGLGMLRGMGGSRPIQDEDRLEVSVWAADQRDRTKLDSSRRHEAFPALTVDQVLACLAPGGTHLSVLLEVSAGGQVSRCEAEPSGESAAARCTCGQLQKGSGAAWLSGKRWDVNLDVDRRDQTSSDRRFVISGSWNTYIERYQVPGDQDPRFRTRVEDPSIEAWTPGPAKLATGCFVTAFTREARISSRWAVWFDGAGQPTKVVEQKGFPALQKELAQCVARALKTAQSPCPSRPGLWAMGDLHVSARDPNAPPPSLKEVLHE